LHIGPLKDGTYVKTGVKTVHVARTEVDRVWAGHDACFALSLTKSHRKMLSACKGVVALKIPVPPTKSFAAEIFLMKVDPVTMIHGRYQTTVYTFFISSGQFSSPVLRLSTWVQSTAVPRWYFDLVAESRVIFIFVQGPAYRYRYVRKGMRIILRDGHARGIGVVLKSCQCQQ
jgi:GTPase